MNFQKFE